MKRFRFTLASLMTAVALIALCLGAVVLTWKLRAERARAEAYRLEAENARLRAETYRIQADEARAGLAAAVKDMVLLRAALRRKAEITQQLIDRDDTSQP